VIAEAHASVGEEIIGIDVAGVLAHGTTCGESAQGAGELAKCAPECDAPRGRVRLSPRRRGTTTRPGAGSPEEVLPLGLSYHPAWRCSSWPVIFPRLARLSPPVYNHRERSPFFPLTDGLSAVSANRLLPPPRPSRVPLWLKLFHTAFLAVLIPV